MIWNRIPTHSDCNLTPCISGQNDSNKQRFVVFRCLRIMTTFTRNCIVCTSFELTQWFCLQLFWERLPNEKHIYKCRRRCRKVSWVMAIYSCSIEENITTYIHASLPSLHHDPQPSNHKISNFPQRQSTSCIIKFMLFSFCKATFVETAVYNKSAKQDLYTVRLL